MCAMTDQSSLLTACMFRSIAAFSASLTLTGGLFLFHTSTLSNVLQRHEAQEKHFKLSGQTKSLGCKLFSGRQQKNSKI